MKSTGMCIAVVMEKPNAGELEIRKSCNWCLWNKPLVGQIAVEIYNLFGNPSFAINDGGHLCESALNTISSANSKNGAFFCYAIY